MWFKQKDVRFCEDVLVVKDSGWFSIYGVYY